MRLISARIRGYGRLVDAKINLDAKVIAIVGPNEAGKTTLLKALGHITSGQTVPVADRSRVADVSDDAPISTATFVLEDGDRAELAGLELAEPPTRMEATRTAGGGNIQIGITPTPRKSVTPLHAPLKVVREVLSQDDLDSVVELQGIYGPDAEEARDFRAELTDIADAIDQLVKNAADAPGHDNFADEVGEVLHGTAATDGNVALRDALGSVVNWCKLANPHPEARNRLWRRTPDFWFFAESDRSLESAYILDDNLLGSTPPALSNLTRTAGLDLSELYEHIQRNDIARRDSTTRQANIRLAALFKETWKQSDLTAELTVDGNQLRVSIVENGERVTVFGERSAGLRMFVALTAYLKVRGHDRPPILLIDEAETHLHIDAQADLVSMFMAQEQALKVIYTTHSPACLPPDLGSGIRAVVPRTDNLQVSEVKNSFWQGSAGYSPLMLAMGAAAAAFTPARCVVLAEGASEMLLLPSLLRATTEGGELPYQIAPGLSEVPKDFYPQLDFEAAKVVYLVDSDGGGDELANGLTEAGVPTHLVVRLGFPGVENLLDPSTYLEAVAQLLPECNPSTTPASIPALPTLPDAQDHAWAKVVGQWVKDQGLQMPSKVALANWLVENRKATPSAAAVQRLRDVHVELSRALGIT